MGPFPESKTGNRYILVVADYFTKWTEAYLIHNQEATTMAQKITDEFFLRFSLPEQLHSDQSQNFESAVIADICKLLAIKNPGQRPIILKAMASLKDVTEPSCLCWLLLLLTIHSNGKIM